MKKLLLTLTISIGSLICALPVETIKQKGDYLKGLITNVHLGQFKKDAAIFFEFDPEFPPTKEAIETYKFVADELVEYAKITRAEKFEERKLLLGTTIHNSSALVKALICAPLCAVGIAGTLLMILKTLDNSHRPLPLCTGIGVVGGLVSFGFGYLTKRYWTRATNHSEIILQQMKSLNEIIDQCKAIQTKMHSANPTAANPVAQDPVVPIIPITSPVTV